MLGDAAYPLRLWLITPYRDNGRLTAQQKAFNTALSSTRVTVERAFGFLKGRFRRLQRVDKLETAVHTVVMCTILHNICIINEDGMQDYFNEENGQDMPKNIFILPNDGAANQKRDNIARNY